MCELFFFPLISCHLWALLRDLIPLIFDPVEDSKHPPRPLALPQCLNLSLSLMRISPNYFSGCSRGTAVNRSRYWDSDCYADKGEINNLGPSFNGKAESFSVCIQVES